MNVYLIKAQGGFIPADIPTEEWAKRIKYGSVINADFKKVRNPAFHRKFMALLNVGFDNCDVEGITFERFRKDVTILAGYYHTVVRLDKSVRVEADSISFASMEESDFEKLYNQVINVLLKHVYNSEMSKEELDNIVNQYLSFT